MDQRGRRDDRRLRNRRGDPVDPVPFVVCVCLAFMFTMSVGPLYGLAYGLSLAWSIALSTLGFCALALVAYRQLVRSAPPIDAGPLPVEPRFVRLAYVAIGLGVALVGLTLPLF
ncbi:hypothetical protein EKH57_11185 [Halorubrum sp. BOL3-1]|uniref:hypothetical protein n=1 Tax=Halorubrum sp. BOL3-1 TaxID=2497325 RepID=UPI001004EAED|nr:hypothetical protein [Halorubrum sp. BOL3-1]QAU13242.1 hypothetical protein EKH57_11185 [Halorubrum sp. BOL3-1]